MGLHSFLERLGFVRLRDFGLLLTPDRRIVTTREVLDDGYGATVVGWEDSDLAAAELVKKRRATTNGGANVAFRPLPPPPPTLPTKLGVVKKATAPMMAPVVAAPIPPPVPASPAPVVAAKANVIARPAGANPFTSNTVAYPSSKSDSSQFAATEIVAMPTFVPSGDDDDFAKEDEWEWQIAKARAQPEDKTPTPVGAAPVNPFAKEPRHAAIHHAQVAVATSTPRTIIPVPSLPAAVDARRVLDAFHPPALPRRMARGTRPVNDEDTSTSLRALPARR